MIKQLFKILLINLLFFIIDINDYFDESGIYYHDDLH